MMISSILEYHSNKQTERWGEATKQIRKYYTVLPTAALRSQESPAAGHMDSR